MHPIARYTASTAARRSLPPAVTPSTLPPAVSLPDAGHAVLIGGYAGIWISGQIAAQISLDLAKQQFESGYAGYLPLLTAEQAYQQAVINLVQARANRYADTAALLQALGGGWWHRSDLASKQP